uniref:ZP domain-containing protein n=1 Tax=Leptobrachium leishanense TaxID=445787 RepID=A0A8C5MHN3_9ANUR
GSKTPITCFYLFPAGSDPPLCDDCAGSCDSENGCLCSTDYITSCVPTSCIMNNNICCTPGLYWNSSFSCCTDVFTIACSPPCAADQQCVYRNNNAICECNNDLYIGKTIANVKPIVQCDPGVMTASVSQCLLTYLGYDYNNLDVRNKSTKCSNHYPDILNGQNVEMFQVKAHEGSCGTTATVTDSKIYYTNTLYIDPLPSNITTDPLAYNFTCDHNLTMQMQTRILYAVSPSISVTVLPPETGNGLFYVYTAAYKDSALTTPWEAGESIAVGSDIFLPFSLPEADPAYFTLRVDECFAAPAGDSNDVSTIHLVLHKEHSYQRHTGEASTGGCGVCVWCFNLRLTHISAGED